MAKNKLEKLIEKAAEYLLYTLAGLVIIIIIIIIFSYPTTLLWNWLCPKIFGLPKINIFESLGLLLLSSFLFKGSINNSKNGK